MVCLLYPSIHIWCNTVKNLGLIITELSLKRVQVLEAVTTETNEIQIPVRPTNDVLLGTKLRRWQIHSGWRPCSQTGSLCRFDLPHCNTQPFLGLVCPFPLLPCVSKSQNGKQSIQKNKPDFKPFNIKSVFQKKNARYLANFITVH